MKRGQAFETMMLVISVIVALAILAVLLGILGNLGTQFGSDPKTVMRDGLREVNSKGFGLLTAKKATFDRGAIILEKEIIGDTPILPADLSFTVHTEIGGTGSCSGTGAKPLATTTGAGGAGDTIQVCTKIEAFISVCGDSSKTNPPRYCVSVARTPDAATNQCQTTCLR